MTALHLLDDSDPEAAAFLDSRTDYAPRLVTWSPEDAGRAVRFQLPAQMVPALTGPAIACEHGDAAHPGLRVCTVYAADCIEARDPSWWRAALHETCGAPALRLVAYTDWATLEGGVTLASVDAGVDPARGAVVERVVLPPEVLVRVPGVGVVWATATDEVVDGTPVVGVAETTARRIRDAMRERR